MSSSGWPFFQNLSDGTETITNGIPHYKLVGAAGANAQSYGFMIQIPLSAKGMSILVRGRGHAGSADSAQLFMSGAFQNLSAPGPTAALSSKVVNLGTRSISSGGYVVFNKAIDFDEDFGLTAAPGEVGLFAIFRPDASDNQNLEVLSTTVKFRM
jgi:hypothetical protein